MSLSALLRSGGDAARAAASAAGTEPRPAQPSLRHAPSLNDFSLGCAAELAAQDEHLAAAAAARRADAGATHRLAAHLAATHLSLRKSSPSFEDHYQELLAKAAALDTRPASGGRGGGEGERRAAPSLGRFAHVTPQPFAPGSCPPLVGVQAWASHLEERHAARRPGSLDLAAASPRFGAEPAPPSPTSPHGAAPSAVAVASPSPSPPSSPGRAAAAFAAAPHSSLHMDASVKEALLCGGGF